MNLFILIIVIAALFALRFLKLPVLGWLAAIWIALYIFLGYGIEPPLPSSILWMFMGIATLSMMAYLTADSESLESAKRSITAFLVDRKFTLPLIIVVVAIPLLVATKIYLDASKLPQPPVFGRTIHPAPPVDISFKGKNINLGKAVNPFRKFKTSDPEQFQIHVENGRRVYYENCVFCHGDNLQGDGIFAHGFDPIPANFSDPTTIGMLQESYLFWRIAKGAPGLPEESAPWASAMPAWEEFLTEEEIWDVILFLYEFTGQIPRSKEAEEALE